MASAERETEHPSYIQIPKVRPRPRRVIGPPPDPDAPVTLAPAVEGLLHLRHAARMARAEWRSLHPDYLNRIQNQLDTERAVEENLERGRALVRRDIQRATDPALFGIDRRSVTFPRLACVICEILRPVLAGIAVMAAPFLAFFALTLVIG